MTHVSVTVDETEVYDSLPSFEWETYQRGFLGILNNAYNQSCNTGTKVLGDMSEITAGFDGGSYEDFLDYYEQEWDGREREERAIHRMTDNLVARVESVGGSLPRDEASTWAARYIESMLVNSYRGFMDEERALQLVAGIGDYDYEVADPSEESAGVDGYIEGASVQVKPASHKSLDINSFEADILITYEYDDGQFTVGATDE